MDNIFPVPPRKEEECLLSEAEQKARAERSRRSNAVQVPIESLPPAFRPYRSERVNLPGVLPDYVAN